MGAKSAFLFFAEMCIIRKDYPVKIIVAIRPCRTVADYSMFKGFPKNSKLILKEFQVLFCIDVHNWMFLYKD